MEQVMERLAGVLLAHRRLVLAGWLLLCALGGVFAAGLPGRIVSGGEAPASSQSEVVAREVAHSPLPSLFVTIQAPPADQARVSSLLAATIRRAPLVTGIAPMPATAPATPAGAGVVVLNVTTRGGTDGAVQTAHLLSSRLPAAAPPGVAVHLGGFGAYRDELTVDSQHDLERAERVGLPIVLVVLLLTFGTFVAAGLPLLIALSALLMGLGGVGLASYFLPMSDFVTNAASMIGLALGVDYAMFLVQRVRELRRDGHGVDDAVRLAMRTTGLAVLWSGITVLLAEATLFLIDSRSIRSAAFGMTAVTLFAIATAVLVAPVLISLLGDRLTRGRGLWGRPPGRHRRRGVGWRRWSRLVTRHAPAWLLASVALMVALAVPATKLHASVNIAGPSSLPSHSSVRQAYAAAASRYGTAAMSPVVMVVPSGSDIARVTAVVAADPEVARAVPQPLPGGRTAMVLTLKTDPYSAAARAAVERLRGGATQSALGGIEYQVGGETASSVDATRAMFDGLPEVGLALLAVIGFVLLVALRSVFLPVKAVLLVVVSLGASLGSLLLLVTTKIGAHLIGANGPQDIHPIVPITIVAVTVALSTDYEVILISRIAEHYRRYGSNRRAIVHGLSHTGGVVTSAAAIMVAVFSGFALADLPPLKQLGVGLGLAVFLDATVVRGVLVPAAMTLMGRGNWWWPGRSRQPAPKPAPIAVRSYGRRADGSELSPARVG